MKKFIVLDDVFDKKTHKKLIDNFSFHNIMWCVYGSNPLQELVFDVCKQYFDLSSSIGYELWCNAQPPSWHYDKDESTFRKTGKIVYPLCSMVYYAEVKDLKGGDLLINNHKNIIDLTVVPKSNRLVMFTSGILHAVTPFMGTRKVISYSPWHIKPDGYDS